MAQLVLPEAPPGQSGLVKAWRNKVTIPAYLPLPAEHHPMFLERRVYQGSSGKVYPLPVVGRVADVKTDVDWDAVHLENEYLRVMLLPALGGRIHVARDKTNGYDFIYRQDVIKPALVGLGGPWISGGIEFNWPQHHRPSTFMPTDVEIEHEADGSVTVWCGEHEPMNRMMGVHGVRLRPGRSTLELRVRLYNRTELTQTFLWWANVATEVNEYYQSFFPPDVRYVADHAKRATSTFPRCSGRYYGVDYAARGREGVPARELPTQFVPPPGMYPPDDLSWYANIPVPTSYMCTGTSADFFGGYDHAANAGIVHVANHHISPGKKQWTWGNHAFGYAWDRNLTDPDERGVYRPYIELMAGVYTDNQPDFSYLAPGETKTFTQCWYPIREIGPAIEANEDAAVSLSERDGKVRVGVAATARFDGARVVVGNAGGVTLWERVVDLAPDRPALLEFVAPVRTGELSIAVYAADGRELLAYRPSSVDGPAAEPQPAVEPPEPADVASIEELYLIGLHLNQYRHATRPAPSYWREALRREPSNSRCNTMMGDWHLRRGEFSEAARYLRRAIATLTQRNPNPRDGEAYYLLGVSLRHLSDFEGAYGAFYKATWNAAWQSPAHYELALLDCRRLRWVQGLGHLEQCLRVNTDHLQGRDLRAILLRRLGRDAEATAQLKETIRLCPVAYLSRQLNGDGSPKFDAQIHLDFAWDLWAAGLVEEACETLDRVDPDGASGAAPMLAYTRAAFLEWSGKTAAATEARRAARSAPWAYCFPSRLEEIAVLRAAMASDPSDPRAPYYLGNLLFDRQRYDEAIECWEQAAESDSEFAPVWRNLGIGYFNIRQDMRASLDAYERAVSSAPEDGRLLYERDQLWKRTGVAPRRRLEALEAKLGVTQTRDDLSIELAALYNLTDQPEVARQVLSSRRFQPWEGGEGMALGQHKRACLKLGRAALERGDAASAVDLFREALHAPDNLGEARHLLANQADVHHWLGVAYAAAGDDEMSRVHHTTAAESRGDFQEMSVRAYSEMTYYSALSMAARGHDEDAATLLSELRDYADGLSARPAKVDYFATSLPDLLLFNDDLNARQRERARFLLAQSRIAAGEIQEGLDLLRRVLAENPNHADAADLLAAASTALPVGMDSNLA